MAKENSTTKDTTPIDEYKIENYLLEAAAKHFFHVISPDDPLVEDLTKQFPVLKKNTLFVTTVHTRKSLPINVDGEVEDMSTSTIINRFERAVSAYNDRLKAKRRGFNNY